METENREEETIDFDIWSEEDETSAIAELTQEIKVRHVIKGRRYFGRLPDGAVVSMPARLKFKTIQKIGQAGDDAVSQLMALLDVLGDAGVMGMLEEQDVTTVIALADDYFTLLARISNASVGESRG